MDLSGRTAVVTGASSGIGEAVARKLAAQGASVALLARRKDRLEAIAAECGGLAIEADVSSAESLAAAAAEIHDRLGAVDLVVPNAGFLEIDPVLDADPLRAAELVTTNLTGAAWTARMFADDLRAAATSGGPADVVFVSSSGGGGGGSPLMPMVALYGATKAAVAHLAVAMRAELAPAGVRVHDIEPSWTTTPLADAYAATRHAAPDPGAPRPLSPDDVADVVAFCVAAPPGVNLAHVALTPTWLV